MPVLLDEYQKTPEDPRIKYDVDKNDFLFLVLGRVSKLKGQDIALEAFLKSSKLLPNSKMVIVGRNDYESEFSKRLLELAENDDVKGRVIFTGGVDREEVLGWLHFSSYHVIPVRFMNSGAVVVESWASHTPVIQSDVVDPNLVEEGVNGFLFEANNSDDLARKLVVAYENSNDSKQLAINGNKLVQEKV